MKIKNLLIVFFLTPTLLLGQRLSTDQFKNPSAQYKPKTWLHSMSGNMSKVGFTKDLEAIADVGIGGVLLFTITGRTPKGPVKFNSDEHLGIITHVAAECERLNLGFGVHNCDGWTSSGGPWNTPANSMKMVAFSEIVVTGGKQQKITLPQPTAREDYYQDVAVLAYPASSDEIAEFSNVPKVTSNDPTFNIKLATDGRNDEQTVLNSSEDKRGFVQFAYDEPFTAKSIFISFDKAIAASGVADLLVSDDGVNFKKAASFKAKRMGKREQSIEDQFDPITAKFFRIETEANFEIAEIKVRAVRSMENTLGRTSMFKTMDTRMNILKVKDEYQSIQQKDIIDLTKDFKAGVLTATLPAGKWTILRIGYTSTGYVNSPASEEGRGLEVDKMSRPALKIHFDAFVGRVIDAVKPVAPIALQYMEIDSYEVGGQNWTQGFQNKFKEKYGYDLVKFLPLYAGKVIESPTASDAVLGDIRKLNSELITENYFAYFTELCHEKGVKSYIEPYSINGPFEELDAAKHADIPMGEFWMHQRFVIETAVSGAHIYGKNIISAESFSAQEQINWRSHPGFMKLTGDKAWALGINEFMFHRYAHQPNTNVSPGMTMDVWGSHIDRNQTWWNNAGKAWFEYIARGQYLLRQGIPVADLLVFVGDGAPSEGLRRNVFNPAIPDEINYDCVNKDALLNRFKVEGKELVLPEGTRYKLLGLQNTKTMELPTLRKLHEFAEKGIILVGEKPEILAGYAVTDDQKAEFKRLTTSIWSKATTYGNSDWEMIYAANNLANDLMIKGAEKVNYAHRKSANEDVYFLYNPDNEQQTLNLTFNMTGKMPELWNPMTGETTKIAAFTSSNNAIAFNLPMEAEAAVFVIFREEIGNKKLVSSMSIPQFEATYDSQGQPQFIATQNSTFDVTFSDKSTRKLTVNDIPEAISIDKPWNVTFSHPGQKTATTTFDKLTDWTANSVETIKHFSGTAIYTTDFDFSGKIQDVHYQLDLGKVDIAARVILNGKDLGVLWKYPFTVDITDEVKKGKNTLKVEVTNQWTNRLIGDEQFPDKSDYKQKMGKMPEWYVNNQAAPKSERSTFTTWPFYEAKDELLPAGLHGPVRITASKLIK